MCRGLSAASALFIRVKSGESGRRVGKALGLDGVGLNEDVEADGAVLGFRQSTGIDGLLNIVPVSVLADADETAFSFSNPT